MTKNVQCCCCSKICDNNYYLVKPPKSFNIDNIPTVEQFYIFCNDCKIKGEIYQLFYINDWNCPDS